ncbi:uncharacterized protein BP01DRAFT_46487 [Aspergillus saccharolyticus JOP 1030-1]|uniref:Uncharacterized protein n=1 Tax=Aspergillus saccharolyticus JOP 1030-1 TaxID=1450539 RepID=A0A318ZMV4_9EURO|nr:hypothetical protein BP01DRAFT_46487 [Aspergillus saccharolyticus JOP 1030-1]PYH45230.1 hypothetical protein BP01DRAFT_46487 [Aspergillus saccharolyticus JOP 1030-1]
MEEDGKKDSDGCYNIFRHHIPLSAPFIFPLPKSNMMQKIRGNPRSRRYNSTNSQLDQSSKNIIILYSYSLKTTALCTFGVGGHYETSRRKTSTSLLLL